MKHHNYENLTGEHTLGDLGQIVIFCLFMAVWISDIVLKYSNFLNNYLPAFLQIILGALILILAAYMAVTGMNTVFGKNSQNTRVIKTGVFKYTRHPIYLI